MNYIKYDGKLISIGETPAALLACGYRSREEVIGACARFALNKPVMIMKDVVEYFTRPLRR